MKERDGAGDIDIGDCDDHDGIKGRKGSIDITALNLSFSADEGQLNLSLAAHEHEHEKGNKSGMNNPNNTNNKAKSESADVEIVGSGGGVDNNDNDDYIPPLRKGSMDMSLSELQLRKGSMDLSLSDLRKGSIDMSLLGETLSTSLDHIVKGTIANAASPNASSRANGRKYSDASALIAMASLRKDSDADGLYSLSSLRKDSDVSALSTLVRDEEEMMLKEEHEEDMHMSMNMDLELNSKNHNHDPSATTLDGNNMDNMDDGHGNKDSDRKYSDPFENLRKLSDASDNVLRKLSDSSDVISLRNLRKDSDGDEDGTLEAFKASALTDADDHHHIDLKSPGCNSASASVSGGFGLGGLGGLGDMKLKSDHKDDASIGASLFGDTSTSHSHTHHHHHPSHHDHEPNPVFVSSTLKGSDGTIHVSAQLDTIDSDKNSDDGSVITINAANQRMLMDALLDPTSSSTPNHNNHMRRNRAESWGGMSDISIPHTNAVIASTADIQRGPSPHDFGGLMSPSSNNSLNDSSSHHLNYDRERHENVSKRRSRSGSISITDIPGKIAVTNYSTASSSSVCSNGHSKSKDRDRDRDRSDSFSVSQIHMPKAMRERAGSITGKRLRLDSWCGTRDRIDSVSVGRDRLDSLANLSGIFSRGRDRLDSLASLGEVSLSMSLGDLEDVAGKLESIVHGGEDSSACDDSVSASENATSVGAKNANKKSNSSSLPAPTIQVDSEAVQSAVQAAMAATSGGVLDLLNINSPAGKTPKKAGGTSASPSNLATPVISNAKLKHPATTTTPIQSAPMDEAKMEEIRARARAAAGYVHPGNLSGQKPPVIKSKKRPLPSPVQPSFKKFVGGTGAGSQYSTPVSSSKFVNAGKVPSGVHMYSDFTGATPKRKAYSGGSSITTKTTPSSTSKGGQSNQKWEEMFECLVVYVKEQRIKETANMSEEDKAKWEWSGNVPTMYKTKDGKALGRWINNQRSAKSKGSLKIEREQRLVSTGLKWSVLTTNAWTDMMEELKIYVREKTKDGKKWDGNVPTNYKIKNTNRGDGNDGDEDKNLGRWINRQRSLYQAGKLKEERRKQLEDIGLKWAVLSTTSWHTMYESLCRYANAKRDQDKNRYWDGNVPASYETNDKPAKKLGRWINRQRSAYANKKLKKEFVDKLEKVGLKWTAMDSKKDMETSDILLRQRVMTQPLRPTAQGTRPSLQTTRPGVLSTARPTLVKSGTVVRQVVRQSVGTVRVGVPSRPGTSVSVVGRPGMTQVRPTTLISSKPGVPTTIGNTKVTVLSQARPLTVISSKPGVPTTVGNTKVTVLPQVRTTSAISSKPGVPTTVGNMKVAALSQARPVTVISSKPGVPMTVGNAKVTTMPQARPVTVGSKPGVPKTVGNSKVTTVPHTRPVTVTSYKPGGPTTVGNAKVPTLQHTRPTTTVRSAIVGNTKVSSLRPTQPVNIISSKPTTVGIISSRPRVPSTVGNVKVPVPQQTIRSASTISSKPGVPTSVGNAKITALPQARTATVISTKPVGGNAKVAAVQQTTRPTSTISSKPGVPTTVERTKVTVLPQARPGAVISSKPGIKLTVRNANVTVPPQARTLPNTSSQTDPTHVTSNKIIHVTRPAVAANIVNAKPAPQIVGQSRVVNGVVKSLITTNPAVMGISSSKQIPPKVLTNKSAQVDPGQMKTAQNTPSQINSKQINNPTHKSPTLGKMVQVTSRVTPTLVTKSHVSTTKVGKANASIVTQNPTAKTPVSAKDMNTKQLNAPMPSVTTKCIATISSKAPTIAKAVPPGSATHGISSKVSPMLNEVSVNGTRPIAVVQGNVPVSKNTTPVIQKLPSSLTPSSATNAPVSSSALPGVASNKMC